MQLRIEVVLADAVTPAGRAAALRRIVHAAGLRDADIDAALRGGVLRGTISSERVLDLALLDVVADFVLTVD